MKIRTQLVGLACVCFVSVAVAATPSHEPLTLLSTTPLPNVTGGDFDHFAVDLPHSRFYVSAEDYGSIEVFGLPDGRHLASEKAVAKQPHKIVLTNEGKRLFIADAGEASVKIVDTDTFQVKRIISLEPQPDSGVADERTGIFYVGNGGVKSHKDSAYVSLISMTSGTVIANIAVPAAQVKAMVIDRATDRLFVNFRDKNEIGIVDLKSRKMTGSWHVPGPSRNSAMAFDPTTNRLFIGSRNPGKLFVLDASTGSVVQSLDIVETSDEIIFDEQHRRLYVAGASGLDVVRQIDRDRYEVEQHVDTSGGKTAMYVPSIKRLYVIHTRGPQAEQAGLQVFGVK
jgi:DNA-binding beta-propeller fold protein YncE